MKLYPILPWITNILLSAITSILMGNIYYGYVLWNMFEAVPI